MKNVMKKMKTAVALLAAGMLLTAGAHAQVKIAIEGQAYMISSATDATFANATSTAIQWYRNGVAIPSCTTQVCIVPAELCTGDSVRFVRKISGTGDCVGDTEGWSNEVIVMFKCGGGHGTRIGSLCWADRNVDAAGTFTATASDYGMFYQWNSNKAWPSSGEVTGWNSTPDESSTWTVSPGPCPTGWRLPTQAEFQTLHNAGHEWVNAAGSTRGNATDGRFYGSRYTTCTLPNNSGCIFLPASGFRNYSNGVLFDQVSNGYYWSSTQGSSTTGYGLHFYSASSYPATNDNKALGFSIRCVQ